MTRNGLLPKLSPPLPVKSGWPWTEESKPLPRMMSNNVTWPKISIVTPSYNQGQFLEETIRSVLLQNYPNLEYIIMDGGSTDNSVAIIKKYEPWLTYWVSEKDGGQADAIYNGFKRSTGTIIGWLNSDDLFMPGALSSFAEYFVKHPNANLVISGCVLIDQDTNMILKPNGLPHFNLGTHVSFRKLFWLGCDFHQPATLWKRNVFFEVGGFDTSLKFSFDYDMYLRISKISPTHRLKNIVAAFRLHPESKTTNLMSVCSAENDKIRRRYIKKISNRFIEQVLSHYYSRKANLLLRFEVRWYRFLCFMGIKSLPSLYR